MSILERITERPGAFLKRWCLDTTATAFVEFSLIFPLLMMMLLGVVDLGNGIMVNQKSIAASQIIADLVSRNITVNAAVLDEAVRAGELALSPFSLVDFGVDIVSVQFAPDDSPQLVWRETRNMIADANILDRVVGLGTAGDGALAITVSYVYRPLFGRVILNDMITMEEVTFARGRRSAVVGIE